MSPKQAHSPVDISPHSERPNVPEACDSAVAINTLRSTHVKRRPCCSKEPTSQAAPREKVYSTSRHMPRGGVSCQGRRGGCVAPPP